MPILAIKTFFRLFSFWYKKFGNMLKVDVERMFQLQEVKPVP